MNRDRTEQPNDWGKRILLGPLLAVGILAAVASSRASRLRRAAHAVFHTRDFSPGCVARIEAAVIGMRQRTIASILGPARTSAANAWYYTLDPVEKSVLAIEFDGQIARRTHVVRTPEFTNPA
jgi:hypothetical protein